MYCGYLLLPLPCVLYVQYFICFMQCTWSYRSRRAATALTTIESNLGRVEQDSASLKTRLFGMFTGYIMTVLLPYKFIAVFRIYRCCSFSVYHSLVLDILCLCCLCLCSLISDCQHCVPFSVLPLR